MCGIVLLNTSSVCLASVCEERNAGVWHLSLALMNIFNKTEAAFLLMQAVLSGCFPISKSNVIV